MGNDSPTMDSLLKARVAGQLSRKTYWSELKRRGELSSSFDPDAEELALAEEGTGLGTEPADPASTDDPNPTNDNPNPVPAAA